MWIAILIVVLVAAVLVNFLMPETLARLGTNAERKQSGLTLRQAEVEGFAMPYLEGGQGEPLLLIHGFSADKDNFTRVARFLTPHYRVIIPDLPGFGDAGRDASASYFMADQVRRVAALLAQLGITHVHVGGNSMGGFIAAQFAATYPVMTGSVWLLDPAGTAASYDTAILKQYQESGEMPLLVREPKDFDRLLRTTMHKLPFIPGFLRTVLARRAVQDFALHTRIMKELNTSPLLEDQYPRIDAPAYIVWGAEDRILNPSGADTLRTLFPRHRVNIMPGIGHLPMLESPKRSAGDYLQFRREFAALAPA